MSNQRFRYSLDALLRKRRSDWKTVKMEEATASQVVARSAAQVTESEGVIEQTEESLRQARHHGAPIDIARHDLLTNYLKQQHAELAQRQMALKRARELHERIQSNLEDIGRGIKSLEKHRAGREAEHLLAQQSLEQNRMDELWLLRSRNKSVTK